MTLEEVKKQLDEMSQQLNRLPEIEEPPPTTLQLLGQGRQESDWQRFLEYFLTPDEAHGLEHSVVEQLLQGLQDRDDIDFVFSPFDLEAIKVATEVPIADGRPDLILWSEEWFILFELKIDSSEREGQTSKYANAESFNGINLDPTDVPEDNRYYLYVAPEGSLPESNRFVAVEWRWVASQLRSVKQTGFGSYPARTTRQLDDFIDTIESEVTMTKHDQNETAKAGLYTEYYDEISEVVSAFETEWNDLLENWGRRVATTLDDARLAEDAEGVPSVPAEDVIIELPDGPGRRRYWVCRQANGQWSWLFPTDWWTDLESGEPVYRNEHPNARVGFLHRPDFDRKTVLGNHQLTFYLRNAPSGNEDFYPGFASRFNSDDMVAECLPENTQRRGVKSNVLESTYNIRIDDHGDLFTAYTHALAEAIDDHIVSNYRLIKQIDGIYTETLTQDSEPSFTSE